MKKIITILAAIAVAIACDNAIEDIPQNPNNGGNENTGGNTGNEDDIDGNGDNETVAMPWAALADSCTTVLIDNFMNKDTGTFWASQRNSADDSHFIYWQQAHALDVVLYAYARVKDTDPKKAEQYMNYIKKWYENDANNYNNSHDSEGEYGGFYNDFTDDMAWICLTLMHIGRTTGEDKYFQTAKDVFDKYMWPRKITDAKGTGLPWKGSEMTAGSRNACTNAPSCLVSALLYQKYKGDYLEKAETLYDYCIANMPDGERVEEPPLTYTQGTFGEACRQLYHITKDNKYMSKAAQVLMYAFESNRCTNTQARLLRHEGESMDQALFKAVLIPYAVNYVLDPDAAPYSAKKLTELIYHNAKSLSKNLNRRMYPRMYCGYYWGEPASGTVNMGAQASGASLMEGAARLEAAGLK